MHYLRGGLIFLILPVVTVTSEGEVSNLETNQVEDLPRYVVFPGLDANNDEIAEWNIGFASPFNVFFGPKPYVLGWVGDTPFAPVDEAEEDIEEGEEEGELDPDYDYEKQ